MHIPALGWYFHKPTTPLRTQRQILLSCKLEFDVLCKRRDSFLPDFPSVHDLRRWQFC